MGGKSANKAGYFDKLKGLLEEYKSIFIVTVDNVGKTYMARFCLVANLVIYRSLPNRCTRFVSP